MPGQRTGPDPCLEEVWVKKLPCHSHRWAFSAPGTTSSTPALNSVDKENLSHQRSGPPWREGRGSLQKSGKAPRRRRHFSHVQRDGGVKVWENLQEGTAGRSVGPNHKEPGGPGYGRPPFGCSGEKPSLNRLMQWRKPQGSFRHSRTQSLTC